MEKGNSGNKPLLVTGFGKKNFGKQYKQGNRVYDSDCIAMCVTSSPVGHIGGVQLSIFGQG